MDSAQSKLQYQQHQQAHFPPSPPPSPPAARHRHKHQKKHYLDPFFDLGEPGLDTPPSASSHVSSSPPNEQGEAEESLLVRIIVTPILFTSFLLSLFLVNRSDRVRRSQSNVHNHPSTTSSLISLLSPSAWLDPEPYQDPTDTTWERRDNHTHVEPNDAISPKAGSKGSKEKGKNESWHLHKKIRKVAKLEISDAFEMRKSVIAGMFAVVVGSVWAGWWAVRWAVGKW